MSAKIETVLFDLDETLIHQECTFNDHFRHTFEAHAEELAPITAQEFLDVLWPKVEDMWFMMVDGVIAGNVARRYIFRNTLRMLKADLELDEHMQCYFDDLLLGASTPEPDVVPVLQHLVEAGYNMGVITNGYSDIQYEKLKRNCLDAFFETVLVSEDSLFHKPAPGIFLEALTQIGGTPETTVYIGDQLHADIRGAQNAGIRAILYDPRNTAAQQRQKRSDLPEPDETITALAQLPHILNQL
jgi:putative hydrolase of the HAD superfamily